MKKCLSILCIILIIIACVIVFRNYSIISKINAKSNEYSNIEVYSYKIHNLKPRESSSEIYRKNNILLLVDNDNSILYDKDNDETIIKDLRNNEITKKEGTELTNKMPLAFQGNLSVGDKLKIVFNLKIQTEKVNEKECYIFKDGNQTTYVYKDTYLIAKVKDDNLDIEYLDWQINPNLDKIIEQYSN